MKELNDKDFDQAFKTRITEELPEFEEESWLKMEQKLKKRDRLLWYRYASILLLFLSLSVGIYALTRTNEIKHEVVSAKKVEDKKSKNRVELSNPQLLNSEKEIAKNQDRPIIKNERIGNALNPITSIFYNQETGKQITSSIPFVQNQDNPKETKSQENIILQQSENLATLVTPTNAETNAPVVDVVDKKANRLKVKRKLPISLALSVGPDFNSTTVLVGGKTSLAFGLNVGIGLTNKLSVQTGLNYGSKNYSTSAYDYTFSNPNANKANFTMIKAACKVLEIPLRASYNVSENKKRSIEVNAGLSSYIMLKENYVFEYTPSLNKADRVLEATNENQHILSVVDLSATYNIKLKNKKLALGIEPYLKIPLTGIGEGKVPLNSSGLALKVRYDFNKK